MSRLVTAHGQESGRTFERSPRSAQVSGKGERAAVMAFFSHAAK